MFCAQACALKANYRSFLELPHEFVITTCQPIVCDHGNTYFVVIKADIAYKLCICSVMLNLLGLVYVE